MGTWGVHSFDNDDAADFVATLEAEKVHPPVVNAEFVGETLEAVFAVPVSDLDAVVGAKAVAAAEVIAAALGHPRNGAEHDPFELATSFKFYDDYLGKAVAVLSRVRADGSELAELWADTDDTEDWHSSLADLEARLRTAAATFDLSPDYIPPDEGGKTEEEGLRDLVEEVYSDLMAEVEKLADTGAGDTQVEVLRHLIRKLHLIHNDITSMRYFVVDSLDALTARIDGLEGGAK
ncbi:MAG: DUF4259 domain-containing protein [Pseudomonadota bacterium]